MDNFEHILDGRALLTEMSERAAGVKVLVTSRERLQLRGEQLFPLQGLEIPQDEDSTEESLANFFGRPVIREYFKENTARF
jgi:predicted ATPase